jgi:hypothetical protein
MAAGVDEFVEVTPCLRDRVGPADPDAIESERARFVSERVLQGGGRKVDGGVQKSRST